MVKPARVIRCGGSTIETKQSQVAGRAVIGFGMLIRAISVIRSFQLQMMQALRDESLF
jgi:hypothetical protein